MGKVQDTIKRIRTVSVSDAVTPVALLVPSQHQPTATSFPVTAPRVAKWLAAQNWTDLTPGVANLTRALQHSNRLHTAPIERLRILALFEPKVQKILPHLNSRYAGLHLPHANDALLAFNQVTILQQELSFGYKIALLDVLQRRSRLARKHRIPAIYQAIKHLGACGFSFSQTYRGWPKKTWRDINTLYMLAERENGVDTEVPAAPLETGSRAHQQSPTTIRLLYAQLCAFSISDIARLDNEQMCTLFRTLGTNSNLLEFSEKRPADSACTFSIALNSSMPPAVDRFCLYSPTSRIRYFSMHNLMSVDLQEHDDASVNGTTGPITRACRHRINQHWNGEPTRTHSRSVRRTELYTQTGLKEIYASIRLRPPTMPQEADPHTEGSTHANPPLLEKPLCNSMPGTEYDAKWNLVNESHGGMGLLWTGRGNCRTRVGDPITSRHYSKVTGQLSWQTGIVRWLSNEDSGLTCGVENIASHTLAVCTTKTVQKRSVAAEQNDKPPSAEPKEEALLINDHPDADASQPIMLLVANYKYKLGETLTIHLENGQIPIKLVEKIDFSADFQSFAIRKIVRDHATPSDLQETVH